jgi:hypothetical protein
MVGDGTSVINGLKIKRTFPKAGGVVFYGVIGFRAPSFPDLSMGDTAARLPVLAGGNAEGAKVPLG